MNILLLNGSPKGERSNTLKLARAFVDGIKNRTQSEVKEFTLSRMNIGGCRGCFACWDKTPGKCIISDDMASIIEAKLWADVIIWSFPLYYFSVPGVMKNMIDRQLPMSLPFMIDRTDGSGSGGHPSRYDMSGKKNVIISTCGFYTADRNYDSITLMFDHFCGRNNYESILCGQGELFRVPELAARTSAYLETVRKAGEEYSGGGISDGTRKSLEELLFPKEQFEAMADASWGVNKETGEKEDQSLVFTKQMALLYNRDSYDGRDRVVEICYTDIDKTYQILLGKDGSKVYTDGSLTASVRIDTPWDVWVSISRGEIGGAEALAAGKYRVSGDLDIMMHWDKYFGVSSSASGADRAKTDNSGSSSEKKPPVMATMLIAWITFWVAVSVGHQTGAVITAAVCALIPLIMMKRELNIYDRISIGAVGVLSAFAFLSGMINTALVAGYLGFGLLWLVSCLTKEPVCASYVKYSFGGDKALGNPIFMKTNYILAAGWGVLYILIAVWSGFMLPTGNTALLQIVNNGATVLMSVFTGWFQKWYPVHMMSGKK